MQLSEKPPKVSKMNPLTQTLNQLKMNEKELAAGVSGTKSSWHTEYKDSAWIFLGGLPYEMTEGDIICMFSQYGEPVSERSKDFFVFHLRKCLLRRIFASPDHFSNFPN